MTYAPSQSAPTSTTKTRHLQELARQLKELAERTETLKQLSGQTAVHAEWMRQLGGDHAAWFMASERIMLSRVVADEQPASPQREQ
ncbi:hypothetical protein JCM3775_006342 [Rhodotorula graminis]